ncbi:unnamed protein product [Staurois parvus]|uniref:Uncharacterized protein n=1 Tax=Staurois parvus TaxID=386267 RepID=A0ABN9DPE4_9NEOB|nr:unnamed protein product [Staurois parvus]
MLAEVQEQTGRWHAGRGAGADWQVARWQRCRSRLAGDMLVEVQEQTGRWHAGRGAGADWQVACW